MFILVSGSHWNRDKFTILQFIDVYLLNFNEIGSKTYNNQ